MAGYQFFVGVGAGVAMLAIPVVVFGTGPGRLADEFRAWIDGPPPAPQVEVAGAVRPQRGYLPGDPTPTPLPAPTVRPATIPTPRATSAPAPVVQVIPGSAVTWRAAVVRSGTGSVTVHYAAGVDSPADPVLPDGSPVLVGPDGILRIGDQDWVAVRGLNNVVGWVPKDVVVDGYSPPPARSPQAALAGPTAQVQTSDVQRARVANTDGQGVVLRASPRDEDRTPRGLMEGVQVSVLEWSGTNWVRVRADNGAEGWVPTKYLTAAN